MMRASWWWRAVRYVPFLLWAWLRGPYYAKYATPAPGWCGNRTYWDTEPRLPPHLSDYMTPDNSLWGDRGHKERRPDWREVSGMEAWLRRNPAYGRAWRPPYAHIAPETATYARRDYPGGEYDILASDGAFEKMRFYRIPATGKFLKVRTGWSLADVLPGRPCLFLLSIRVKAPPAVSSP